MSLFKSPENEKKEEGNHQHLAIIPLSGPVMPDGPALTQAIADLGSPTQITGFSLSATGEQATFTIIEDTPEGPMTIGLGAIGLMPKPVPGNALQEACERSWRWPEAWDTIKAHTHHWVVYVSGGIPAHYLAIVAGRILTALTNMPEVLGVYLGSAGVVHDPAFIRDSFTTDEGGDIVDIWVHICMETPEEGQTNLRTVGLAAFGAMEIEVVGTRLPYEDAFLRVNEFAAYAMEHGPVLKDGDTIGEDAEEKITVRHEPSIYDPQQKVCRIYL